MSAPRLEADRETVGRFLSALFAHADTDTFIALRAFDDEKDGAPPIFTEGVEIGSTDLLVD